MKVAICFSGSIRDLPTCLPSLKRYVLNNLDADIFLHLWKMDDISKLDAQIGFKWKNDRCEEQYVIEQLKPISYVIDTYSQKWEDQIIKESGIILEKLTDEKSRNYGINACGMYYKIYRCFQLVEEYSRQKNIVYDLVIRARLDFIWEDHVKLSDFSILDKNTVYLIQDRYATYSGLKTNDKFFAGSMDVMRRMCHLFHYIKFYQSQGRIVEGQTLHQVHMKTLRLEVKWIGHKDTYYKCMGRHRLASNHKHILIGNQNAWDDFLYELSYYLLYRGYHIIYQYQTSKHANILDIFPHFEFYDETSHRDKISCYIGNQYQPGLKIQQIIINPDEEIPPTPTGAKPGLRLPAGAGLTEKVTLITINERISFQNLIDFIVSVITTQQYGGCYHFTDKILINDIDPLEKIIFKYLDHGYYSAQVSAYNPDKKKYTIRLNKETMSTTRDNLKIVDLLKYHQRIDPFLMPVNK